MEPHLKTSLDSVTILNRLEVGLVVLNLNSNGLSIDFINDFARAKFKNDPLDSLKADLPEIFEKPADGFLRDHHKKTIRLLERKLYQVDRHYQIDFLNHDQLLVQFTQQVPAEEAGYQNLGKDRFINNLLSRLPKTTALLVDASGVCVFADGTKNLLLKIQPRQCSEANLEDFIKKRYLGPLKKYLQLSTKGKEVQEEIKAGKEYYEVICMPFKDKMQQGLSILLIRNITRQKSIERELNNHIEELSRSNQNLEQFAYVASHDLQEPLRKIRAFGDRLKAKYHEQLPENGKDYIDRMNRSASRMQVLIDDLLKYSRISRMMNPFEPIDLEKLASNILDDLETTIEEKQAVVKVELEGYLDGDKSQIYQLLQNLLSNALKFNVPGRTPEISIRSEKLTTENNGFDFKPEAGIDYLMIQVRDNGIGFDNKYRDRIFNIFQRLHGRNEFSGTGIGLAICKKIAENHGGTIFASGNEGEGAEFTVILPENNHL